MSRDNDSGREPVQLGDGESYVTSSTPAALLVVIRERVTRWVPRSVIHDDSEVFDDRDNTRGKLIAERWWAERNELC